MSVDNFDGSGNNDEYGLSIDEMLASGDPDLIELGKEMQAEMGNPVDKPADENDATQGVETDQADVNEKPTEPEQEQARDDAKADGVFANDGKNIIPYKVLETTRTDLAEAQRNLQAEKQLADQHKAEIEKLNRQIELAKTKGVELPILPEDEEITDDMLEELADISPEMGVLGRKMKALLDSQKTQSVAVANAQQAVQTQQQTTDYEPSVVQQHIAANPAISAIMQDPKLSKLAIEIEKDLVDDPQYASLDKRYAEVAKRVGGAKGIDFAAKYGAASIGGNANLAPHEQSPTTPHSLSDIPSSSISSSAGKTPQEVLAEQSPEGLHSAMEGMSMEQIEALLAG